MKAHFRRSRTLIAAFAGLLGVASSAAAQQVVAFGAAEFSGQRRSVQLLGFAVSSGLPGWSPVLTVTGLRFTFPSTDALGVTTTADAFAVAPSLGMRYQTATGSTGVHVGYIFVNEDNVTAAGSPVGSSDGVFVTFQADYWGRGEAIGQLLASYNFGGEYLWSRAKGGVRMGGLSSPLFVGAEAIVQGGGDGPVDVWTLQVGPVLMFQVTPNFRLDLSGGARIPLNRDTSGEFTTGYGRIEFVALLPRFMR